MSVDHFKIPDNKACRHTIDWAITNIPTGFASSKPDDIGTDEAWQFGLQDEEGNVKKTPYRVHGYVYERTFYIVWLDHNHFLTGVEPCSEKKRKKA